jgi:uncharacterized integral membrane protein
MLSKKTDFSLWKKWTLYCAAGELLGIGVAGVIAFSVNTAIGEPQTLPAKLMVLSCMMLAGAIEGSLLGVLQWRALKDKFPQIPLRDWWFYTVLVAVLGWFLGMMPSLFFVPAQNPASNAAPSGIDFENPLIILGLSTAMGLVLGAIFGLFQWFALRKQVQKAHRWILANALGWGLGLAWIYLLASLPDEQSSLAFNVSMGILGGLLAGLSVGAVTGIFLLNLVPKQIN